MWWLRDCTRREQYRKQLLKEGKDPADIDRAYPQFPPLKTPSHRRGKPVIFKKDGVVYDERPYEANSVHPCQCGCIYDVIDAITDPNSRYKIYQHRHIDTGEWTECQLEPKPMEAPRGLLFYMEYKYKL